MNKVEQYKSRFNSRTNEELKDIIAGRFEEYETEAIEAAIILLKKRHSESEVDLSELVNASDEDLIHIIKNPDAYNAEAVEIAKTQMIARKHTPVDINPNTTDTQKGLSIFLIVLAVAGVFIVGWFLLFILYILMNI